MITEPVTEYPGKNSAEQCVRMGELELVYERMGSPQAPAILLIMGLGGQLVSWPQAFCHSLIAAGYQVIRFDNRDSGLSTKFSQFGPPPLIKVALASSTGRRLPRLAYRLEDMANDCVGLLDSLQIKAAHIVGVSMGGMIGQLVAVYHPQKVLSLSCLMTSSGHPSLPGPTLQLRLRMLRRRAQDPARALEDSIRSMRLIGSPGFPRSDEELRGCLKPQIERNICPHGVKRQLAAILASGDRSHLLSRIQQPTLILHGAADPLIPVAAAHDLKLKIRHSQLTIVPGLGHDLPAKAMPILANAVLAHVQESAINRAA